MSNCYEFALECNIKCDVSQEVIDTLKYMTRSREYDFDPPKLNHALFRETLPWKRTVEMFGRKITVIKYEWRTILTNHPREGEQHLPGKFGSTFQNNQLSCRRLSRDGVFDNVWWLLFPWLASISESVGFVGYYRGDWSNYPNLIRFRDGKASIYELIPTVRLEPDIPKSSDQNMSSLDINASFEPVKQELMRQAENSKISLEAYASSLIVRRWVDEDVFLSLEQLPTN